MIRRIFQIALILFFPLFSFGSAYAKGAPARITIKGPGISEVLEITDEELLEPFSHGQFVDFSDPIEARNHTEGGYIITRYVLVGGRTMQSLDTFTYFPGSGEEESIVFYKGIIDKKFIYGGSPYDNMWFRVSEEGEQAFLEILAEEGVSFEVNPSWIQLPNDSRWLGYGGLLVIVSTIFILVYRRRFSNQPPV